MRQSAPTAPGKVERTGRQLARKTGETMEMKLPSTTQAGETNGPQVQVVQVQPFRALSRNMLNATASEADLERTTTLKTLNKAGKLRGKVNSQKALFDTKSSDIDRTISIRGVPGGVAQTKARLRAQTQ